ncbi:MAG: sulfatase-like hydrolase/transferase [Prevotellaceae bacterium]|nr:sulfatase-like hydrolase/transferase [Prevotellaceae bacterium]
MIKGFKVFFRIYLSWLLIFILQKPLFMLWYHTLYEKDTAIDWLRVIWHGLSLDLSVVGYLTVIPGLLLTAISIVAPLKEKEEKFFRSIFKGYFLLTAFLIALIFCLNIGLYEYWQFPLDNTPFFYFLSSPKDAFASITIPMLIGGILAIALCTAAISALFLLPGGGRVYTSLGKDGNNQSAHPDYYALKHRVKRAVMMLVLTVLLFLPIRGGVTVSTMNMGYAYFSDEAPLNHAAVNPAFSLLESLSHRENFKSQYRFMDDKEAQALVAPMLNTRSDSVRQVLRDRWFSAERKEGGRPDIYLFILESFSRELMKTAAVPTMNQLAREGIFFDQFYANSWRTDRGMVAILSGYPAQPNMSIMKYSQKATHLPSLAAHLHDAGYTLHYYYGGDADFTNMRAYVTAMGFTDLTSDTDFPLKQRLSKWGVPDGPVIERMQQRYPQEGQLRAPRFTVVQTSSSHEPFDVPWHHIKNVRLNAFNYTDHCIAQFIQWLKATGRWKHSLVILCPDHLGCYPEELSMYDLRHFQIPLIFTGGAIKGPQTIHTLGSQQDIAATVLGQLGIRHDDLRFSKDMLGNGPHFAFYDFPDAMGMVTEEGAILYDNSKQAVVPVPRSAEEKDKVKKLLPSLKAYLQVLFDDIDKR